MTVMTLTDKMEAADPPPPQPNPTPVCLHDNLTTIQGFPLTDGMLQEGLYFIGTMNSIFGK